MPGEVWTRCKRRPAGVRFNAHLAYRSGTKQYYVPAWGRWVWWRPHRYTRGRRFRPSTNF